MKKSKFTDSQILAVLKQAVPYLGTKPSNCTKTN